MSKKLGGYENYRVVIEPRRLGDLGSVSVGDSWMCKDEADRQRKYRERCEEIAADVKRHVDNVGYVSVECDTLEVCEHCGSNWTEESATYNGGCCDKDQEAEDASIAADPLLGAFRKRLVVPKASGETVTFQRQVPEDEP